MTDSRMSGSVLKNLHVFGGLCGMEKMPNVVLVTTFWGGVEENIGASREAELKATFWKPMLDGGCTTRRFKVDGGGYVAAWNILGDLLSREPALLSPKKRRTATKHRSEKKVMDSALVSDEIVDDRKSLNETEAGVTLSKELRRLEADHKRASDQLRKLVDQPNNKLAAEVLQKEIQELEKKVAATSFQLRILRLSLPQWFRRKFSQLAHRW
jgi:hypothetical protein